MQITWLPDVAPRPRRVAVGEFDGVHLGHRAVVDGSDTVLTFEPHPMAVVRPDAAPKLLTSLEVKAELIAALGVEELIVIPFDAAFAHQTAQEFVDDVLVGKLGATHVSVGENFRFGHGARGDTALLRADGRFEARVVPLVEVDGEIVSSSHVRGLVQAGLVERAATLLDVPFRMRGEVQHGEKRGRELGFPTANLVPDPALVCPANGVYATRVSWDGGQEWRCAATNVGVRPTFETGLGLLVEAYVLDYSGNLYGKPLTVEFVGRLRGEQRFPSADALIEQMQLDVAAARAVCAGDSATLRGR
ncbi:bifunctional riboflavin kinase/FAD synthetase [Conexibacter sp. JD483]|uniref:bifunctional riboflavin kinase/FAD synthetase n=1 Tax=unclassified Conexibacter TaxID=2627773 RepID=UPI00272798CE|nr:MULTISPECIES: bifunctional riboflavin kinase/FAD synthetase [unclassified Conexibacter]MDO8188104.1 bifunctional riboflavin kinase/FAD synthetase [Conexibacter sp. CPCC 205706]MDO8196900.1 bifunctional riboflavin kinase/FAD synthetase [Conexibacter sp. CPCC 205762]MDR9370029.1 bifunctional riboflavin kinase/FAD synthetase [Conexibacter sp. JD483]